MGLAAGEVLQNRYRVVSPLGQGGMGAVYRAWDTRLKMPVALKEMTPQPGLDPTTLVQLRQQFEQEAAVVARLNHPHLVRVIDFFEERGNTYLVMDFVEGESLANRIEREGALPEAQVLTWAGQLLDALAYCHSQGVIHRDIKPQNVIIRPDGRAMLVDFGLVKLWDPRDPHTRTVMRGMGTPEYAPPEQYSTQFGHTDPRSDIYGLGAMLYHALTGQQPLTANDRMAFPGRFKPVRELNPQISAETEKVISNAMELAVEHRFPTARDMAAVIDTGKAPTYKPGAAPPVATARRQPTKVMSDPQSAALPLRRGLSRRQILYGALALGGSVVGCGAVAVIATLASQGNLSSLFGSPAVEATETPAKTPPLTATSRPTPRPTPQPTATPAEPTPIRWFIGLLGVATEEQISVEREWVAEFNARQDEIDLTLEIVDDYDTARDTLLAQLAAGDPPDVVGPIGVTERGFFHGLWLDMTDYLEDYDLSDFSRSAIDAWRISGQGLIGLAINISPSALYINRDLFDQAGIDRPPQSYAGGSRWTVEALEEIAMVLTVDAYGNDATSGRFNPDDIVQFGYTHQWTNPCGWGTFFGAGSFLAEDDVTARCPDHWREAFKWYYRGMWEDHFAPNSRYLGVMAGGNPFNSGNVAMAHSHLWYICCIENVLDWDYAIIPAYGGVHTAKLHTDAIGVLNLSEHPDAAVEATYAIATSRELIEIWGETTLPALQSLQGDVLATLDERFPHGVNWQTIVDGLNHIDVPSHESWMPNFSQARERIQEFQATLESTPGLDMDAEIDTLITDLQAIFDAA